MGANHSKPADAAINEKLLERLHALQVSDEQNTNEKQDCVMVEQTGSAYPTMIPRTSRQTDVSTAAMSKWEKELMEDPKNRLALAAFTTNSALAVLSSRAAVIADSQNFNIKIPIEGSPVTNQAASGRCWLFASTNIFRIAIMKKFKLSEFQLSQSYLFYWDKIEKANYFLENILDTKDEDIDSRIVQALMASPVGDGGQFDMVVNLVQKYGLIPHSLYPDSYSASSSGIMDKLITTKLRENAVRLRSIALSNASPHAIQATIAKEKERMLREIHLILTLMLGPPPSPVRSFTWEYYDRDGHLCSLTTSPTVFAQELSDSRTIRMLSGTDVNRLFSLVNDPRNTYNQLLGVKRLGNVWGGRPVTYVNVEMDTIKEACIAMLKRGNAVFFGSDVGKYSDSAKGIMDIDLFDYELGFNINLGMSKAERLQTGESQMTHAMVLTGVHVVDGKPVRWRVQNSWGEGVGDKGFFVMSDKWMSEFVYQAVVDPTVVSETVRKVLKQEPRLLELWDPMGALA